ncbi:hypothetical protein KY290_036531 [Solanum tuberosum]|uniref:Uncharacterized protein n=1 Tax=Solanum tuberosum TaxID=4113 RepID=A0ABQ7TTE6_SOLTU|nr:hypothetical protein KY285_035838 [Solanum tuberosum]KAH0680866.1 hypothetical protein KY284_021951 [Solanum tuberosum]KAH0737826.1 hypothetical protein KY290_036531 [Solanum tuberosum]
MAREPPAELPRSPDDVQMERLNVNYKTHPATLSDSSYNSTNLQNTVAINTAISVKELEGTRKIIPPEASALIHGNASGVMESPIHDLHPRKKSSDSTAPIDRNHQAIFARDANESPESRSQLRATSSQVRADSTIGDYSPHEEVHFTEISSRMDGGIASGGNSDQNRTQLTGVYEKSGSGNHSPTLDILLSEFSSKLDGGDTNKN